MILEGTVLVGSDFEPVEGRVHVEDGVIQDVEEVAVESDDIVLPAFVNAHTHVGDSVAKEAGGGLDLEELVAPPDGLKHRLLAQASEAEQIEAMAHSLAHMQRGGTATVIDFREEGVPGVRALRAAAEDLDLRPLAFGRGEPDVLEIADGYGASSTDDGEYGPAREAAAAAGKPFAIHAGELDTGDIHPAIDLEPAHLVHMVHAESEHLDRVADAEIPIVVCPRSNLVTGVGLPPIEDLRSATTVALGTDNVMLNGPSMFREMAVTAKTFDVSAREVLSMATRAGRVVADQPGGTIEPGEPADIVVLDGATDNLVGYRDPVRAVVRRAGVADVTAVHLPGSYPGEGRTGEQ